MLAAIPTGLRLFWGEYGAPEKIENKFRSLLGTGLSLKKNLGLDLGILSGPLTVVEN